MTAKPKKINAKRLLKLAAFLDKLPRSHFSFATTHKEVEKSPENICGSVGCAIGWCPTVFPTLVGLAKNQYKNTFTMNGRGIPCDSDWVAVGGRLFDMPRLDAFLLFTPADILFWSRPSPWAPDDPLRSNATPKQVAKRIRTYVAWKAKQP